MNPITLPQLQTNIQTLGTSSLSLSSETTGVSDLDMVISAANVTGAVSLTSASVTTTLPADLPVEVQAALKNTTVLSVQGTGSITLLGATANIKYALFFINDNKIETCLVIDLPSSWTFKEAFPSLPGYFNMNLWLGNSGGSESQSLLYDIGISNASIVLSSVAMDKLQKGINFYATDNTVSATGSDHPLSILTNFANSLPQIGIEGSITPGSSGQISINTTTLSPINIPLPWGDNLSFKNISVGLETPISVPSGQNASSDRTLSFDAALNLGSRTIDVNCAATLTYFSGTWLDLKGTFSGIEVTIDEIASLIPISGLASAIPSSIAQQGFKLNSCQLKMDASQKKIQSFILNVQTLKPWKLFGNFGIGTVDFQISAFSSSGFGVSASGDIIIDQQKIAVIGYYPNFQVKGTSDPTFSLSVNALLISLDIPSIDLLNDLTITKLDFALDPHKKLYSFSTTITESLSLFDDKVTLNSISISLKKYSNGSEIKISGIAQVLGYDMYLSATHQDGAFTFVGSGSTTETIGDFLGKLGIPQSDLPDILTSDLSLSSIDFQFNSKTKDYSFSLILKEAVNFGSISGNTVAPPPAGNNPTQAKSFGSFNISGTVGGSRTIIIKIDKGLHLGDLIHLQNDLPSGFNPELGDIKFELDSSAGETKYTFSTLISDNGHTFNFDGVYTNQTVKSQTIKSFGGSIYSSSGNALSLGTDFPLQGGIKDLFIGKLSLTQPVKKGSQNTKTTSYTIFGSDLSAHAEIDLNKLPVVGAFLSEAKFNFKSLRFVYAKASKSKSGVTGSTPVTSPIPGVNLTYINDFLSDINVTALTTARSSTANANKSKDDYDLGFTLQGTLVLGNNAKVIPLHTNFSKGVAPAPKKNNGAGKNTGSGSGSGDTQLTPSSAQSHSSPTPVGKKFGPVTIDNVGLGLSSGKIDIKFTGGLTLGPLTLDFIGFEVKSPIDHFDPSISLQGLGLDIKKPPLTLEGLFMESYINLPDPSTPVTLPAPADLKVEIGTSPIANAYSLDMTRSGTVSVGSHIDSDTITISSSTTLAVTSVESSGDNFSLHSLTLPSTIGPSSSGTFKIRFTPQSKGFKQGLIIIKSKDPSAPRFEINLIANKTASTPTGVKTVPVKAYNGSLSIGYKQYSLAAVGSYAQLPDGAISTFLYGFLGAPMGGPPFFFVTGVAAGFGYNRAFTLPNPETINTFPLIQPVMSPGSTMDFDSMNLLFMPTEGEFWGAVGVRGESFKMVESFILLDVQFKKDIEIDIIGMSKMHFPKPPSDDPNAPALAKINIGLVARIIPEMGIVTINGAFLPGSYVYNPLAHISGGFAVLSVFKDQTSGPWQGAQEGDFVVTLGGYASTYKPKSYYPHVPRLELNWQINSNLSVKAQAYFAITPQAMMAGGDLVANFQIGGDFSIHVNFTIGADFIIYWKPYHYLASFYANLAVTASITVDLWLFTIHASISLDLGADLDIWGPSFSGNGTVYIHVLISFSVHVSFGDTKATPIPIPWSEFSSGLLPAPAKILTTNISNGLVASQSNDTYNVVNPKELEVFCATTIPVTPSGTQVQGAAQSIPNYVVVGSAITLDKPTATATGTWTNNDQDVVRLNKTTLNVTALKPGLATITYQVGGTTKTYVITVADEFGIKPMAKVGSDLAGSNFDISISNVTNDAAPVPANDHFTVEFVFGNVPAAMWEPETPAEFKQSTSSSKSQLLQNVITGAKVKPLAPEGQSPLVAHPPEWETLVMAPSNEAIEFNYDNTYSMNS